jgi:hypothetical protein
MTAVACSGMARGMICCLQLGSLGAAWMSQHMLRCFLSTTCGWD